MLMYGKEKLVFEDVFSALLSEDFRKPSMAKSATRSTALNVERGRSAQRYRGRSQSRSKSRSARNGKQTMGERLCWNCNKPGHMRHNCPEGSTAQSANKKGKGKASTSSANVVIAEDEDYAL